MTSDRKWKARLPLVEAHSASAAHEIEGGEDCLRVVGGHVDDDVGSSPEVVGQLGDHVGPLHVDHRVGPETLGQLETIPVVAQPGDPHPSGTGRFGCDETSETPGPRA
jgi:hypothetical protein